MELVMRSVCTVVLALSGVLALTGSAWAGEPLAVTDVRAFLQKEVQRSKPDYIVYVPGHWNPSCQDNHNEHFLVFEGAGGRPHGVWDPNNATPDPANRRP